MSPGVSAGHVEPGSSPNPKSSGRAPSTSSSTSEPLVFVIVALRRTSVPTDTDPKLMVLGATVANFLSATADGAAPDTARTQLA